MDSNLERDNFMYFYQNSTDEEIALALKKYPERFYRVFRKHKHLVSLINNFTGRSIGMNTEVVECDTNCCGVVDAQESVDNTVQRQLECKLIGFETAIADAAELEIDGVSVGGVACEEITKDSRIKVLNHQTKDAYEVEVDSIVRTPLKDIILALKTGELIRVYGVTRIVGYYSRVQNWNKSKIGELQDRHKGNYSVNP